MAKNEYKWICLYIEIFPFNLVVRLTNHEIFVSMVIFCVSCECVSVSVLTLHCLRRAVQRNFNPATHSLYHTVPLTNHRYASPFLIKLLFSSRTWSKDSWLMVLYWLYTVLGKCMETSRNRLKLFGTITPPGDSELGQRPETLTIQRVTLKH